MLGALGELGRFGRETALAVAVAGRDDAYIVAALRSDEHDLAAWAVRVNTPETIGTAPRVNPAVRSVRRRMSSDTGNLLAGMAVPESREAARS